MRSQVPFALWAEGLRDWQWRWFFWTVVGGWCVWAAGVGESSAMEGEAWHRMGMVGAEAGGSFLAEAAPPAVVGQQGTPPSSNDTLPKESAQAGGTKQSQAVALLRSLGAAVKTDAEGQVVLVDLGNGKANDRVAKCLGDLPELKSLRWTGPEVTDGVVGVLVGLPKLKVLKLDETRLSDAGLAQLAQTLQLEELYLARTLVTDEGMPHLARMGRLRRLRLSGTQLTGQGLLKLASLQELTELDVSNTGVDDASLAVLTKLGRLTRLNLYTTPITDAGLEHLTQMTQLTWLNLDNTRITDAGLPKLRTLTHLEFLHLGRTKITDAGLTPLAELKRLKTLHLTNTQVTPQGAALLQKALPECKILVGATSPSKPTKQGPTEEPAKPAEPPKSDSSSGSAGPKAASQGVKVRLECTVRQYDPAQPEGELVGLVENGSEATVEVPAGYDSQQVLLWAKAEEHPMASAYWDRSREKPTFPMIRLAPGQKQEFFRWPLRQVLADQHKTFRTDYEAGKRVLVWDWEHHAHPPYSPIYQVRGDGVVPKAVFWLVLKLDGQTICSEKVCLEVKKPSNQD